MISSSNFINGNSSSSLRGLVGKSLVQLVLDTDSIGLREEDDHVHGLCLTSLQECIREGDCFAVLYNLLCFACFVLLPLRSKLLFASEASVESLTWEPNAVYQNVNPLCLSGFRLLDPYSISTSHPPSEPSSESEPPPDQSKGTSSEQPGGCLPYVQKPSP